MLKTSPARARIATFATLEIRILTGFLLAMALLLFGGSYTYRNSARFADSVAWVVHTQEVRSTLANVYSALTGAELALRDYTLNGQPGHYEEYQRLIKLLQTRVAALNQLTVDNATQQQNVIRLKAVIDARIEDMATVVAAYQKSGLAAARALTPPDQQNDSTRDVSIITDDMNSIEVGLLAPDREAATERDRHSTLISLLVTIAVAAALFVAAGYFAAFIAKCGRGAMPRRRCAPVIPNWATKRFNWKRRTMNSRVSATRSPMICARRCVPSMASRS